MRVVGITNINCLFKFSDIWLIKPEVTTQASPNTTEPAWSTDAPVNLPEHSVTQFVSSETEPGTSGLITEVPLQYTTQISETQPSPVIINSLGSEEDLASDTTTIGDVTQPETTVLPAEKLPVVPTREEEYTTIDYDEDTTESSIIDQEENETTVLAEAGPVTTQAPDVETTALLPSTTTASNLADTEASGDAVESTTVKVIDYFIDQNIIPEKAGPNLEKTPVVRGLLYSVNSCILFH